MTDEPKTNITKAHEEMFEAVKKSKSVCLYSCFLDGKPTAAICLVTMDEHNQYRISPMWVAVTENMNLTDRDGVRTSRYKD